MSLKDIKSQKVALRLLKAYLKKEIDTNSFLFFGPDGTGKKFAARNFIKAINCSKDDSCDKCEVCQKIDKGILADVLWIEPQASERSISIDTIRHMQYLLSLKPYETNKRVFTICQAELLSIQAQNALLKLLEEPTNNAILILVTSKPHMLQSTLLSRCQKIRFNLIPDTIIKKTLLDEFKLTDDELGFICRFSSGNLDEARRLAQSEIFSRKNEILNKFILSPEKKVFGSELFHLSDELKKFYKKENELEFKDVMKIFLSFFRDCLIAKINQKENIINFDRMGEIDNFCKEYDFDGLCDKMDAVVKLEDLLAQNINQDLAFSNMFKEMLN